MVSATNSPDPSFFLSSTIHALPNELLSSIFLLSNPNARALSQVCRRWREVALGCPVLWARLWAQMLDSSSERLEWNGELLRRSQDLPFDIGTSYKASRPIHLGRALAQSHRWRTFSVNLTDIDDALIPALSRPAPHLEVFCLSAHQTIELNLPASLFADDAPNLRETRLFRIDFNPNNTSIFGNLTTIEVMGSNDGATHSRPNVAQWLKMLNAASLLEDLVIVQAIAPSAAAKTLPRVNLLNLSCMHLSDSTTVCGQLLGHLNAPSVFRLMVCCSFTQHNDDFKVILRFVEARFGWRRPDFDNVGCEITLGRAWFFRMTYKPQESDNTTPYLHIILEWGKVTNTHIRENIMQLFVNPLLTTLDTLMLQTTHLALSDPDRPHSPGASVFTNMNKVAFAMSILTSFRAVRTLKLSGEMQRIVFTLLLDSTLQYPDNNLGCLLPLLRKLELDMSNLDDINPFQRTRPLFDIFVDVVQDRIKRGVGIEAVEFVYSHRLRSRQLDILRDLGVQASFE